MAYLTVALVTARVGGSRIYSQLTDDGPDGSPDPNVELLLTSQVDALADSYLIRGGYTTPLDPTNDAEAIGVIVPPLLDISNYKAKSRRGKASKDDLEAYRAALKTLEMIASGDLTLPISGATGTALFFGIDSEEQLFSRTRLRRW